MIEVPPEPAGHPDSLRPTDVPDGQPGEDDTPESGHTPSGDDAAEAEPGDAAEAEPGDAAEAGPGDGAGLGPAAEPYVPRWKRPEEGPPPDGRRTFAGLVVVALVLALLSLTAHWISRGDPDEAALRALFDRRAAAVAHHDEVAFLATVDRGNLAFLARQVTEYQNLVKLPLAEFSYRLEPFAHSTELVPDSLRGSGGARTWVVAVSERYRIKDVDADPVAVAWLPVVKFDDGQWRVGGEVRKPPKGHRLPQGINGQPWDGGTQMLVVSGDGIVVVVPDDRPELANMLSWLAEDARTLVGKAVPESDDLTALITVVRDPRVEDTHFGPGHAGKVSGFTYREYDQVPEWHRGARPVAARIMLHEPSLAVASDDDAAQLLTHELTHAAMDSANPGRSSAPSWLVEGFAEYVALTALEQEDEDLDDEDSDKATEPNEATEANEATTVLKQLGGAAAAMEVSGLPGEDGFRSDDPGPSYLLGRLACQMIAERYGKDRLRALYLALDAPAGTAATADGAGTSDEPDGAGTSAATFTRVLGVTEQQLSQEFVAYVRRLATSPTGAEADPPR